MNDSALKKLRRTIHTLKEYHDHTLNKDVCIPKPRLSKLLEYMEQMYEDVNSLIIANERMNGTLETVTANALEKINQLQIELENKNG